MAIVHRLSQAMCALVALAVISGPAGSETIVDLAARGDTQGIAERLAQGADPDAFAGAEPPLIAAITAGHPAAAALLLAEGADADVSDADGVPALHHAIRAGALKTVEHLLGHGADPAAIDRDGRTALDLAEGREGVADLIAAWLPTGSSPAAAGNAPQAAGANLVQVIRDAAADAIITLGTGTFEGSFRVAGKHLVIQGDPAGGTVLSGGDQRMVAFVDGGGHLELRDVEVVPAAKSDLGVFVRGAQVTLERVSFTGGTAGAVRVEGGSAQVRDCRFLDIPNVAVTLLGEASAEIDGTSFLRTGRSAVAAQGAGDILVRGSTFTETTGSAISVEQAASLLVADTTVTASTQPALNAIACGVVRIFRSDLGGGPRGVAIRQAGDAIVHGNRIETSERGIVVEGAGTALVTSNTLSGSARGIALRGALTTRAVIARNHVTATTDVGVIVSPEGPPAPIALRGNFVVDAGASGLLVERVPVTIIGCAVTSVGGVGITLQDGATALLADSLVSAPMGSLNFSSSEPARTITRGVVVDGPILPTNHDLAFDPASSMFAAAMLRPDVSRALRANVGTVDRVDSAWWRVRQAAGEVGAVTVRITDGLGRTATPPFEVLDGRRPFAGAPSVLESDVRDPSGVIRRLRNPSTFEERVLARMLPAQAWWRVTVSDAPSAAQRSELAAHLNGIVHGPCLDDELLFDEDIPDYGEELRSLITRRRALVNQRPDAAELPEIERRINRLFLEEIFAGAIVAGRSLGQGGGEQSWVFVPAGRYWIEIVGVPDAAREIVVEPRTGVVVEQTEASARWISTRLAASLPPKQLLVELLPPGERRAAMASFRPPAWRRPWIATPRPGASAEDQSRAADAARRWLAGKDPGTGGRGLGWALRILSAHGVEADVEALIDRARAARHVDAVDLLAVAAHMEARLGRLGDGRIVALTGGSDDALAAIAAATLHDAGLTRFDPALVTYLASGEDRSLAGRLAPIVLDTPSDGTRSIMRDLVDAGDPALLGPALGYLLAWGDENDQRLVAETDVLPKAAFYVACVARDPAPFLEMVAWDDIEVAGMLTSLLHTIEPARVARLNGEFTRAVRRLARREPHLFFSPETFLNPHIRPSDFMNGGAELFDSVKSFHEPAYSVAQNVYDRTDGLLVDMASIPRPSQSDALLDRFARGASGIDDVLDWIEPGEVASGLANRDAASVADLDLFLASHRTTTRAGLVDADHFPVGVERRGYVLEYRASEGGAISGVLDVRPSWRTGSLAVDLRLRQVAQYAGTLISDPNPASWPHHRYVADAGRALVSTVDLIGADGARAMRPAGETSDGWLTFEAPWDADDMRGATVDVTFTFFDQDVHLVVDLFASDAARRLRRLDEQLAASGETATVESALALWNRGRHAEAMRRFEALVDSGNLDALPPIVEAVTSSRRHDIAAALMERLLAADAARGDLWLRLGYHLCAAGDYDGAGVAFDHALACENADVAAVAWWGAGAAWLDGDVERARLMLRLVPSAWSRDRIVPLRYAMAVAEQHGEVQSLLSALRHEREEQADATTRSLLAVLAGDEPLESIDRSAWSDVELCRANWYAACSAMAAGRRADAVAHLREAVAGGNEGVLEHHLARGMMTRLEATP